MANTPPKKQKGPRGLAEAVSLTREAFVERAQSGQITVREALSYIANSISDKKNKGKDNYNNTLNLISNLIDEGIDVDLPYSEIYDKVEFNEALDPIKNNSGTNRWRQWGWFEDRFIAQNKVAKVNNVPAKLAGPGGIAQNLYDLVGVQSRNTDPMQGTIFSKDLDALYDEALGVEGYEVFDEKQQKMVIVQMDQDARDYLYYEKYTGQRVASNIGEDGLKIGDITFGERDGVMIAEVRGVRKANKVRPEVTYTGEFAEFLFAKVEQAKARIAEDFPGRNPSKMNVFAGRAGDRLKFETRVERLWNSRVRPLLEERFADQLPVKAQGSHKSIRKILARQLLREYEFPRDAVKAWMGHAGVGVDNAGDILEENYTGAVPDKRIGPITNSLIHKDAMNGGHGTINALFVNRGVTTPRIVNAEVVFNTPAQIGSLDGPAPNTVNKRPTKEQRQTIKLEEKKKQTALEITIGRLEEQRDQEALARAQRPVKVDPEAIRARRRSLSEAKEIAAQVDAEIKAEKDLIENPPPAEDVTPGLKGKLARYGLAGALSAISTGAKAAPGPLGDLAGAIIDRALLGEDEVDPYDVAVEKGRQATADLFGIERKPGERGALTGIGALGAVTAEMIVPGIVSEERTGNISGRNLARNPRARQYSGPPIMVDQQADDGSIPNP
jgi:hypothetical protein|tara:strand:- start:1517 stop:3523 length:2007 start_codon:yes stop_codon:yes gene_type:complete